jgi:hypothetical protein
MNFNEVVGWAEHHPTESIIIGAGGVLAILWMLGYIGGGSGTQGAADQTGSTANLAAAYYAAEAQQAVVGGQIQVATIQAAAATAMNSSNNNAAVAINAAQTGAATTINQQNVGGALGLGEQNLQATYNNNATAGAIAQSNNYTAMQVANTQAGAYNAFLNAAANVNQQNVALAAYQSDLAFLSR